MSKFKAGDVVVAVEDYTSIKYDGSRLLTQGREYTVLSVTPSFTRVMTDMGHVDGFVAGEFKLVQDNELPPAPESVEYTELAKNGSFDIARLKVFTHWAGEGLIVHSAEGILLTSDEALQLCHDLRRMAMSIKKRERETS